jgi:hypothetical protein
MLWYFSCDECCQQDRISSKMSESMAKGNDREGTEQWRTWHWQQQCSTDIQKVVFAERELHVQRRKIMNINRHVLKICIECTNVPWKLNLTHYGLRSGETYIRFPAKYTTCAFHHWTKACGGCQLFLIFQCSAPAGQHWLAHTQQF